MRKEVAIADLAFLRYGDLLIYVPNGTDEEHAQAVIFTGHMPLTDEAIVYPLDADLRKKHEPNPTYHIRELFFPREEERIEIEKKRSKKVFRLGPLRFTH